MGLFRRRAVGIAVAVILVARKARAKLHEAGVDAVMQVRDADAMDGFDRVLAGMSREAGAEVRSLPKAGLAAFGGLVGALAASSCCLLPLALFTLGVSGAWIGNLTALEPYQPVFFAATAGFLGTGYFLAYRRPEVLCAEGSCRRSLSRGVVKSVLWAATALALAAVAFNYLGPLLLAA
jgi:mercuric ion transport protein